MAVLPGCARRTPQVAPPEAVTIPVSKPVVREVTDFVDFTGRTDAIQSVDIRPRTTGYLVKMPFEEGAEVKEGDLLFVIDPRPYQAQLDQAIGQVNLYQAQLKLARTTLARDQAINYMTPNSISRQQIDQDEAAVEEADARVKAYEKNKEVYRLNHEFTNVVAPISGMVSRCYLTLGNLVNQDQTLLTTIVSLDPMYAYFDMDEPTLLRIRKAINEGKMKARRAKGLRVPVFMGLQNEAGFPHEGDHQLREQPAQSDHRKPSGAGHLSQSQAGGRCSAAVARDVRANSPANRRAPSRHTGDRPGHQL